MKQNILLFPIIEAFMFYSFVCCNKKFKKEACFFYCWTHNDIFDSDDVGILTSRWNKRFNFTDEIAMYISLGNVSI
jgi:hypothetical protein